MKKRTAFCFAVALCSGACSPRDASPPHAGAPPPSAVTSVASAAPPPAIEVPGCPALAATEPPIRFGQDEMVALCRDVYVEPALTIDERKHIAEGYGGALADVARGLGPLESPTPLAVLCKTDPCREYFGGTAKRSWTLAKGQRLAGATFVAPRPTILVLRVDEHARGVIAHETVHVETGYRLHHVHVPVWFHEGLAAIVGGEPRCSGREGRGVDDLRRLDQNTAWADYTNTRGTIIATYCQARAEVDAWLHRHDKPALLDLIAKVRDGASFEGAYGPMLTQGMGPLPTVLSTSAPSLGDGKRPFSLSMWIKPAAQTGVLAHVSGTSVGTGWCTPFIGYDGDKHLVAQLFHGEGPAIGSFAVAVDDKRRPLGKWTHVAMTWAPGSPNKLYVAGALSAAAESPRYNANGAGAPVTVAWGSENVGGANCWHGAVTPGAFQGSVADMRVFDTELRASDVAALAKTPP